MLQLLIWSTIKYWKIWWHKPSRVPIFPIECEKKGENPWLNFLFRVETENPRRLYILTGSVLFLQLSRYKDIVRTQIAATYGKINLVTFSETDGSTFLLIYLVSFVSVFEGPVLSSTCPLVDSLRSLRFLRKWERG